MKLLFLFSFVAIAFAATNTLHAQTKASLHSAALKLQGMLTGEAPVIPRPVHLETTNATACLIAWEELAGVLNSSCGNVAVLYSNDTAGVNISQVVYDQCVAVDSNNHTCQQKVTYAILKFSDSCSGPGMGNIDPVALASLNLWLTMSKIPCIQDPTTGEYCYPTFQSHLAAFTAQLDSGAQVTSDLLNQICIPCVNEVVNQLAVWGIKDFITLSIQLKIACTQKDGSYCMPIFAQATKVSDPQSNATQMALVCDDCTRVIAARMWVANILLGSFNVTQQEELQTFLELRGFLCQQNQAQQYCIPLLQNYDTSSINSSCGILKTNPAGCPGSACQKAIQNFASSVGCCFGTWFDYLDFEYVYNPAQYLLSMGTTSPDTLRLAVSGLCKVPIPMGCAKKKLLVTWLVENILEDWYTAHKQWFEDNFKSIVAYILYVDPSGVANITTTYDSSKGGISVTVTITGFNDADVNDYKNYLSNNVQVTDDSNAVVVGIKDQTTTGASQQASFAAPITISAQSTEVACADSTCWACSLSTPSFSLLSLLLLLLAYFN